MRNYFIIYIITLSFLIWGCKKDEYETVNRSYGKGYANIKTGSYNVYKVEKIVYDDFANTIDTFRYQLKELNESFFYDNLNRKAIRILRYQLNAKSQWDYLNSWYAVEDNVAFERVEENQRLLKLSFPMSDEIIWNTNAYNSDNSNFVYYDFINKKYTLNTVTFDSTISISSDPVSSSLRQRLYNEVYAKGIGLIYKYNVFIDKNGATQRGYRYKQQLIQHVP